MGDVWLGRHVEQGVDVAIKVLREDQARQPRIRQAFLREVQSVARLLHTGIIRIFDYGEVSEPVAAAHPRLAEEAPYIAMELATRGSLGQIKGIFSWRQLRWLLIEVLNALAHAHARELIHRDLKPDNILLTEADNGQRTSLKLTDFGIVHVLDPDISRQTSDMQTLYAGTPAYMSPEQLRGEWRDFGPWTDLYALGCVAYEQACGKLPFGGDNLFDIAHRQLSAPMPEMEPLIPVPDGFRDWVARLLEKRPQDRFQRAADAAWALMQLPELPEDIIGSTAPVQLKTTGMMRTSEPGSPTLDEVTLVLESEPQHTTQNTLHSDLITKIGALKAPSPEGQRELFIYKDAPPLPARWHRHKPPPPSIQLMGAGLGLYGLREIPFVAREPERDRLWEKMREAFADKGPRAVLVRGSTGLGKTRMVQWMGERAHELGAATILKASHSPEACAAQGMARMIARHLNAIGLSRAKTFARLKDLLDASTTHHDTADLDALSLTELLHPDQEDAAPLVEDGPRAQINTPRDRYIVIARLLEYFCSERPIFMFLDDVHWSVETLEMVRLLMTEEQTAHLPIFFALVVNEDAQSIRPASHRLIEHLSRLPRTYELRLEALERPAQRSLVDALLMLTEDLTDEILELSHGNPMFAVQLVGEWIQREILRPSPDGYTLREGAAPFLPATLDQLWSTRLNQLVRTVQQRSARFTIDEIRAALELAAALGQQVSFQDWGAACAKHDLVIPGTLVEALITQGFATAERQHWSFSHEQLRERLIADAKKAGRWRAINQSCAAMIDEFYERDTQGAPERLVQHLIEAEAYDLAIAPLDYLISLHHVRCDRDLVQTYLDQSSDLIDEVARAPDDPRRLHLMMRQAAHTLETQGVDATREILSRARALGADDAAGSTPGVMQWLEARVAMLSGGLEEALHLCALASEYFAEGGDQLGVSGCFVLFGHLHALRHDITEAKRYVRSAMELCKPLAHHEHPHLVEDVLGRACAVLGQAYAREQRFEKATMAIKRANMHFKEVGDRLSTHLANTSLGNIARAQANFAAAEKFYADAADLLDEIHHPAAALPRLDWGIGLIAQEDWEEARAQLDAAHALLTPAGYALYLPLMEIGLACVHAATGELEACRERLRRAVPSIRESACIWPDLAAVAERCSDLLAEVAPADALTIFPIAIAQHEALGASEATMRNLRHRMNLTTDRLPRDVRLRLRRESAD